MQLTGKEIVEKQIISNYCEAGVQQQGLDVRLDKLYNISDAIGARRPQPSIFGGVDFSNAMKFSWDKCGMIPAEGKTMLPKAKYEIDFNDKGFAQLDPGYYEVDLMEGCNIPNNLVLNFKTRSSLVRCGAIVESGQFDAGFHTDKMGCFLIVHMPITIQKGARIAQAIVSETNSVVEESMYNGQWQDDKQRK